MSKLGIEDQRIRLGKPWENGRHERFHRTLKQEYVKSQRQTRRDQQRRFDAFHHIYNQVRPHMNVMRL